MLMNLKLITATVLIATAHRIRKPRNIPMKTNLKLLLFFFVLFLVSGTYLYFAHTEIDWIPGIIFSILFSFSSYLDAGLSYRPFSNMPIDGLSFMHEDVAPERRKTERCIRIY